MIGDGGSQMRFATANRSRKYNPALWLRREILRLLFGFAQGADDGFRIIVVKMPRLESSECHRPVGIKVAKAPQPLVHRVIGCDRVVRAALKLAIAGVIQRYIEGEDAFASADWAGRGWVFWVLANIGEWDCHARIRSR